MRVPSISARFPRGLRTDSSRPSRPGEDETEKRLVNWCTPGKPPRRRRFLAPLLAATLLTLSGAAVANAAPAPALAEASPSGWWLPPNYSKHGVHMDWLFYLIFWITMVIW